jgi:hypothetical protein
MTRGGNLPVLQGQEDGTAYQRSDGKDQPEELNIQQLRCPPIIQKYAWPYIAVVLNPPLL